MKKYLLYLIVIVNFCAGNATAQDIPHYAEIFGTLPEISNIKLSPDGTKLLMFQNVGGKIMIVTRSLENLSEPLNAMPFDKGQYAWAVWLSNDEILAGLSYTGKSKGGEYVRSAFGMVTVDWNGDNATLIADPKIPWKGRQSLYDLRVVDILKDDPDHILIQIAGKGNRERGWKRVVYKRNIRTQKMEIYHQGVLTIKRWVPDKDHNIRLGFGITGGFKLMQNRDLAHYRKSIDRPWEVLYDYNINYGLGFSKEKWEIAPFRVEGLSNNPSELYVTKMNEYGRDALYLLNIDTKVAQEIASNPNYDLSRFKFDDEYNLLSYQIDGKKIENIYYGEQGERLNRIFKKNFADSTVYIESRSEDKTKMILKVTSPLDPGTFYFFDSTQNKMEMLGYNYQKVDVEKLSNMTPITYKARDRLEIPGYLSLPKNGQTKNLPTIIMPHGGPLARDSWRFDFWVQFLNSQGYAVLQMNYRGSTGYGDDYKKKGFHEWGRKMLEDINDGAKWMINEGYADPEHMCIVGASYGGYAALQAIVKDQSLYKCSVTFAPVTNMSREFRYIRTTFIESKDWTFKEASPSENMDKINVPVLMLHGDLDENVDVKSSRYFYNNMKKSGKDIKYIELENETHFLQNQDYRIMFLTEMGQFLKEHL